MTFFTKGVVMTSNWTFSFEEMIHTFYPFTYNRPFQYDVLIIRQSHVFWNDLYIYFFFPPRHTSLWHHHDKKHCEAAV